MTDRNTSKATKPVAITMGCPAGIGPEIIVKHWRQNRGRTQVGLVVIGDRAVLDESAERLGTELPIETWVPGRPVHPDSLNLLPVSTFGPGAVRAAHPDRTTGEAMASYIVRGVELCLQDRCSAMVTCPIAKSTLNEAGYLFPGHTEMIAELTGTKTVAMMMAGSRLRVVLATIHCAISEIGRQLSIPGLCELIELTHRSLRIDFGLKAPRIGVAGLNPHAGESSMFGGEERAIIGPAVSRSRTSGIDVSGPFPPDTIFYRAAQGLFDVVVCMYHDQGLIPFKLLHFSDGVNVTLGLPIVRTSVDHGTAYDIAGKNQADPASLAAAVDLAASIVGNRAAGRGEP